MNAKDNALRMAKNKYFIEKHGDGYAIYFGRDNFHHGMNLGHITEVSESTIELLNKALTALSEPVTLPKTYAYAEVRKCEHCWHVGVDDRADGIACCGRCGWSGDEPKEDKCPSCEIENHMMAACPKCNEEYHLVDSIQISSRPNTTLALEHHTEQVLQLFNRWMTNDGTVADYVEAVRALIKQPTQPESEIKDV